ncbi:MAG: hypothetical protein IJK89_11410 [Clostridia bacterium]|nr:hypothetical protein [Clostridia bacterium]
MKRIRWNKKTTLSVIAVVLIVALGFVLCQQFVYFDGAYVPSVDTSDSFGEFSYPSGEMRGAFAGWNRKLNGYEKDQTGQAKLYADVIRWGKTHGLAGIRYWAPDYEGWYGMSMFEFENKTGTAKEILTDHADFTKE